MFTELDIAGALIAGGIVGFAYFLYYCEKVFYKVKEEFRCFYIWNNHASLAQQNPYYDLAGLISNAPVRGLTTIHNFINAPLSSSGSSWSAITPVADDEEVSEEDAV